MRPEIHDILTNKEVIAVDQDALGREGERVAKSGDLEVWAKQLQGRQPGSDLVKPEQCRAGDYCERGRILAIPSSVSASVRDLWQHKDLGKFTGKFSARVASHGVVMVTVKP